MLCRLALKNEAQHDGDCWASQAQRQPIIYPFATPSLLGRVAMQQSLNAVN